MTQLEIVESRPHGTSRQPRKWPAWLKIAVSSRAVPFWIALGWLFAALWLELTMTSPVDQLTFATPDEAVNRLAAKQIAATGSPALALPVADPENLLHPRHWVSIGDQAFPGYAPVSIYVYGALVALGTTGLVLVALLPASAAAVFAYGTALLLPWNRRFLAVFAPALGAPAFFWLMRPWMNISAFMVAVCYGFLFWALWRTSNKRIWFACSALAVGAGASVRPDYAAYVFLPFVLFSLAASRAKWRWILGWTLVSGALAVAANLYLNALATGDPFRATYQIMGAETGEAEASSSMAAKLGRLGRQVVFPMGVPSVDDLVRFFKRYWLELETTTELLVAQLAIVGLVYRRRWFARISIVAAALVLVVFLASHIHDDLYGTSRGRPAFHHSIPRYWAPVYLLAALPPLLFIGRVRSWFVFWPATLVVGWVFVRGVHAVYETEPASFVRVQFSLKGTRASLEALKSRIPEEAIVYTATLDKALWSGWHVATIEGPEPTAESINRVVRAGLPVFALEPSNDLRRALKRHRLDYKTVRGAPKRLRVLRIVKRGKR